MQIFTTHSAEETQAIAKDLAQKLTGGEFVALIGDLGAGKTTFVQGFVKELGGNVRVKSPTFTVMNEYKISPPKGGIKRVIHVDFYRFTDEKELGALSLEDERRPDTVILAEWPNIFTNADFNPDVTVTFTHKGGDARSVEIG